jgi:hypothetical protein
LASEAERRVPVTERSVVLAVGSYRSVAAAEADCTSLCMLHRPGGPNELAAAVVQKGASGELEVDYQHSATADPMWGAILLGAGVTVLAAPLGIALLASGLTSRAEWMGAAVIVGRLWHRLPRDELRIMGNLLELGQAGLVVVGIDHPKDEVVGCLSSAAGKVVAARLMADLAADFNRVIRTT